MVLFTFTAFKNMLPFLLIDAAAFYLLPMLAWLDEKIGNTGMMMLLLLIITPAICLISSIAYGAFNSFNIFYPLLVALIFIPVVFIFYNESALIYVFGYGKQNQKMSRSVSLPFLNVAVMDNIKLMNTNFTKG